MTEARLEQTYADRETGRTLLEQADVFLDDARRSVNARVGSGDRAHVLRIDKALELLGDDTEDLAERLDAARERRNEASYRGLPVSAVSVDDALEACAELIERVRRDVS